MSRKELFYFTGLCLSMDESTENVIKVAHLIRNGGINWENFVRISSEHLVTPAIYTSFRKHGILTMVPEELSGYLEDIYNLNLNRNIEILAQINEIGELLRASGIAAVFLKGAGNLIDNIYDNPGDRILGDIDFLVAEKDYLTSVNILRDVGYMPPEQYFGNIKEMKHFPRLSNPNKVASVEVHRLPVIEKYAKWFNSDMIFNECYPVSQFPGCSAMSDKHKVILNFIHGQLNNKGHVSGVVSLRDVNDVRLLSKRTDLNSVLPFIRDRKKAIAYFVLVSKIVGKELIPPGMESFTSQFYLKRHNLNYDSYLYYKINKVVLRLYQRVFAGYIVSFITSFYNRSERERVMQFLSNKQFMKRHFASWKSIFK